MNELPDDLLYAEGGTRTPTPLRAQRPERCVSTNFTTSAGWLFVCAVLSMSGLFGWTWTILLYSLRPVKGICGLFVSFFVKILVHVPWLVVRTCYNMFALFLLNQSFGRSFCLPVGLRDACCLMQCYLGKYSRLYTMLLAGRSL